MNLVDTKTYRTDIDGLRAIAVFAVIAFHFGILPNGYLGVDVFFVISGYLITGIIVRELNNKRFSVCNFYIRRMRRILPLTLFLTLVSLLIGIAVMLPDDLENLAQSVIATNLFGNNILQAITTKNYWDVVNEYKPLMHTWSLGVEEQYYLIYPLLLLMIGKNQGKWLLPTLSILAITSLVLYFLPFKNHEKFYYLPFRFFELALGGIAAIYFKEKVVVHKYAAIYVGALIMILCIDPIFLPSQSALLITIILTLGIIITANDKNKIASFLLQNKLSIAFGLISFSLYMWHQIVLSYEKYFVLPKPEPIHQTLMLFLIIILSALSYYAIERPFRNKNKVSTGALLSVLGLLFTVSTIPSLYIYWKGGVIRDVPELGISRSNAIRGIHAKYNARIYDYDRPFSSNSNKIKVLVLGNSFGRDWANVLLESKYKYLIELSYIFKPRKHPELQSRSVQADIIFYSTNNQKKVAKFRLSRLKTFMVGPKNFGLNNGYFYNYSGPNKFRQRTLMEEGYLEKNEKLKLEWGSKYIDYIAEIIDGNNTVPVFTPENMFISQDCRHFTKAGATYFAHLFEDKLALLFNDVKNNE
ncbi:acyltransferase [uncultured Cocleimonas sp.]|uniref:acyltransferase family protein n=1 Tax=uncultured Cocleimonas sp. TaxID=1051587 RepID=UPI0026195FEA|nr:acyltransferase [uncultured Cocleimonas sp.]